jgi:DNA mismatch repair protein MutH
VLESTWVASAVPATLADETWPTSLVRRKLAHVLFVPIADGRVQRAFLWSPSQDEERVLRADWEDLADLVANGLGFAVTARRGTALQLRPKAANASERTTARTVGGDEVVIPPQGFYLRRAFTQQIVDAL